MSLVKIPTTFCRVPPDGQRLINKNSLIRNQIPIAKHLLLGAIAASIVTRKAAIGEGALAPYQFTGPRSVRNQSVSLLIYSIYNRAQRLVILIKKRRKCEC